MPYWIGIDEAGYGPNLGPLTISATIWRTAEAAADSNLYQQLAAAVSETPTGDERIAIADSKLLYKPGGGLRKLERGLFTAWKVRQTVPDCWQQLWEVLKADPAHARDELPWYLEYDRTLPIDLALDTIDTSAARLRAALETSKIELLEIRSRAVFPAEFNRRTQQLGTKGAALSQTTLELLAGIVEPLENDSIFVVCDKHGGRSHYQELLQIAFPEHLVEVLCEGRAESVYRFGPVERRIEVAFRRRGEGFLPAALASMACKYLREACMSAFNQFWCQRVPNLRPTAGYPQDAKRFRKEIATVQRQLNIEDHVLWRNR